MRKLVAMATLLAFAPVAQAADAKGEFSANAEYRIRYQHDQAWGLNSDANTNKNTMSHRFKLDTGFKAGEKFGAHMTLLHNSDFGDVLAGNSMDNQQKDGAAVSNLLMVNQAYGTWMLNDAWSFKVGRGGFTLADGSVVSQNDWQNTPYSFDGILLNWEKEAFRTSFFLVKAADNISSLPSFGSDNDDPEVNFFGFAFDWKSLPEFLKTANIHFMKINGDAYSWDDPTNGVGTDLEAKRDEMRYGLLLAGDTAGFDYKLNYAANTGEQTSGGAKEDQAGMMYAFELGYSMPEMMKSRVHVGYHMDTGDKNSTGTKNENYDTFYYEQHGSSGLMDVVKWGNLTFIKAGYTLSPMDDLDVGLHYWKFDRTEKDSAGTAGINGPTAAFGGGTATDIGSEIDLAVTKKYDGGLSITSWVGMFMPGKYLKDNNGGKDDTYNMLFVEGKMTF